MVGNNTRTRRVSIKPDWEVTWKVAIADGGRLCRRMILDGPFTATLTTLVIVLIGFFRPTSVVVASTQLLDFISPSRDSAAN